MEIMNLNEGELTNLLKDFINRFEKIEKRLDKIEEHFNKELDKNEPQNLLDLPGDTILCQKEIDEIIKLFSNYLYEKFNIKINS